jgi:hypothetical protein
MRLEHRWRQAGCGVDFRRNRSWHAALAIDCDWPAKLSEQLGLFRDMFNRIENIEKPLIVTE